MVLDLAMISWMGQEKNTGNKRKIKNKLDFIKVNIFCNKGYYLESEKWTHKMGENICRLYSDKGLIVKI